MIFIRKILLKFGFVVSGTALALARRIAEKAGWQA
jgi:hypothetical protein